MDWGRRDMDEMDPREELANTLTHGLGAIASALAGAVLIVMAARGGDAWEVVGAAVFCVSLLALYLASTFYHAARDAVWKERLKLVDHCAIYLLIAGTYTPFMIGVLRGGWGWTLFGVVWLLAVSGVVFKLFFIGRFPRVSTTIYVAMGWMAVIAVGPMVRQLSPTTLALLVAGGIAYTAGTPFYHSRFRYAHSVWHLFVLAGSTLHVLAVAHAI